MYKNVQQTMMTITTQRQRSQQKIKAAFFMICREVRLFTAIISTKLVSEFTRKFKNETGFLLKRKSFKCTKSQFSSNLVHVPQTQILQQILTSHSNKYYLYIYIYTFMYFRLLQMYIFSKIFHSYFLNFCHNKNERQKYILR